MHYEPAPTREPAGHGIRETNADTATTDFLSDLVELDLRVNIEFHTKVSNQVAL